MKDHFPLTRQQLGIWTAAQLRPDVPEFNSCGSEEITGPLDVALLRACLVRAIARNDALRLRFDESAGIPFQWVADEEPDISVIDFSGRPDPRQACLDHLRESLERPFDTRGKRLYDGGILVAGDGLAFVYLNCHHLVTDGWGGRVLMSQIWDDYRHVREHGTPAVVEAPSYLEHASTAVAQAGPARQAEDLALHRAAASERTPHLFARAAEPAGTGRYAFTVSAELTRQLRERGSVFSAFTAALAIYLARVHRSDDITLGVPSPNRRTARERRTVGHFADEFPMRVPVGEAKTAQDLANAILQAYRDLHRHGRIPAPAGPQAYDVTLSWVRWPRVETVAGLRQVTTVRTHVHAVDALALLVNEFDDGHLVVEASYARDVFDADFPVADLARHVVTLLTGIAHAPDAPPFTVAMYDDAERERLLHAYHPEPTPFPDDRTLHGLFTEQARRTPDHRAVGTMTYAELDDRSDRIARGLRAAGVAPGDRVAVLTGRTPDLVPSLFAVLKAGAAYVPIDPALPAARIEFLLADCGATGTLPGTLDPAAPPEPSAAAEPLPADRGAAAAGEPAYVIYTSGSTGQPKGVVVEHRSVVNRLHWMQKAYPLGADDVLLQKTPASFDVSVWELFWWSRAGARLELAPPDAEKDPRELLRAIDEHGVTAIHFVPSMLGPLLDLLDSAPELRAKVASLRYVFASGEELPRGRVEQFNRIFAGGPRLVNLYGPTEATVDVSAFDCPTGGPVALVPIGRPIDNVRLYVLGRDDEPQPIGAPGELCVGGVAVARGYLGRPELTAECFGADPHLPGGRLYRTGDLARRLADGQLEYLGRIDAQVKVRGNRVEPGEVRHRLAAHPAVRDAVVVAQRCLERGVFLVGYYVSDVEIDPAELRAHLGAALPDFMVPSFLVRIPAVPITAHGKLDRDALPSPVPAAAGSGAGTAVTGSLAEIWSRVLGVAPIGPDDDYFAIGGDSILALRIRAEAERQGLHFELADLIRHPTLAGLAPFVRTDRPADTTAPPRAFELVAQVDRARLAGAQDAYPASQMALGLLYHSNEHEVSASYHDVFRYRLRLPWNEAAFRDAYALLVARHPALRSGFDLSSFSEPLQVVHEAVPDAVDVVDLREVDAAEAEARIVAHMDERRFHPYATERPPLHHVRVHLRPDDVVLVLSFHHVILDGWSVATIMRDLLQDYLHLAGAPIGPVPAAALPSSAGFVRAEQRALDDPDVRRFWRERLADAEITQIEGLRQYTANEPAGGRTPDVVVRVVEFPDELRTGLRAFAREHGIPPKSVLFAAHCLNLRLFCGSTDVTTGLVTHGRTEDPDADRIAGLFLNTMPLRADTDQPSWLEVVRRVYAEERGCHPYRRFPLHAIQGELGRMVLDTVFNFVHLHVLGPVLDLPGVALLDFETWEQTNFSYLLNVFVAPDGERMALRVDTDARTYSGPQTDLLVDTYLRILARIVADPAGEVDFAFLARPTAPVPPIPGGPSTVVDRLARHVAATPDAPAVAHGDRVWTYRDFDAVTARIARRLLALGAQTGDRVGVALDRSPEMIAAIYGIARAGGVCVPLDVTYPADRVAAMIHRSTPLCVITAAQHAGLVPDPGLVLLVNEVTAAGTDENPAPLPVIDRDSLLYVLFTSGSTGEPKGVAMPHRALDNYQAWQVAAASGAVGGRTLQFAPLSFDVSFQEIYSTISGGGMLQIIDEAERRDMAALLRLLDSAGVERVFVPYVALQQLAETADLLGLHPRKLRVVISSGEQLRITAEIRRFMAALPAGAVLENQYGPTETHLVTAHLLSGDPEAFPNLPPIGSATGGVECHLLDERMRPVPTGVSGELYFGGIQLADGYFGQSELTAQRFIPNPFGAPGSRLYRTGDIARFLPDGTLMWIARSDTQTKIRGHRVEPLEVELAVMREPGVSEAAVVVRRREGVDAFLAAFLVGDEDAVDLDRLRKRLRSTLPDYMVPSHFTWLPAMPLTPSGKRNDAELRRMPLTTGSAGTSAPPRDDCERELAELMADLLQLREVGIHDALFDIGGTSLTAMRLVALVEKRYGVRIPLATFVSAPTVAGLAEVVRSGNAAFVFDPLVTLRPGGDRRPLFLVHPIGGNVLCYLRLAGHLPADQPVYALQAPGGEVGTEPLASVGELADCYLEAIRRVQPEGPCAIGGWSFGGMVAFELAHRLPVDQLLIIDTIVRRPRDPAAVDDRTLLEWFFWELLLMENGGHPTLEPLPAGLDSWEAALDHVGARAAAAGVLRQGTSRAAVERLYRVFRAHWQAIVDYRPEPIGADLTLLRAAQPLPPMLLPMHNAAGGTMHDDPLNGWGGLTRGRIDVVEVPGDHLAMVEEPHVAELARVLAELLRPAGGAA